MNTLIRNNAEGKRGIKNRKVKVSVLLVLLIFSQCKYRTERSDMDAQEQEIGYLMIDGSGYYFLRVDNTDASSFMDDFINVKKVNGFKFNFERDSIAQLGLHYDTLIDLNAQEKRFPSAYIYKRIAPIRTVHSTDSVIDHI